MPLLRRIFFDVMLLIHEMYVQKNRAEKQELTPLDQAARLQKNFYLLCLLFFCRHSLNKLCKLQWQNMVDGVVAGQIKGMNQILQDKGF